MAETPVRERPRRRRGFCFCCCWTLPFLFGLPLLIYAILSLTSGRDVNRALAELRQRGEPLRVSELAPRVKAGEDNAADAYNGAFRIGPSDEDISAIREAVDKQGPAGLAQARAFVADNREYFLLLDEAAHTKTAAFEVNWDGGPNALFPHYAKMRTGARALQLRAEVQAASGDLDGALATCGAIFRIARHASQDPTLIGLLVGDASDALGVQEVARTLAHGDPSPGAARALFDQLAPADVSARLVSSLKGERANGLVLFDMLDRGQFTPGGLASGSERGGSTVAADLYRTVGRPLYNQDKLHYLQLLGAQIAAVGKPWPEVDRELKAIEEREAALPGYNRALTRMITPVFGRAVWSVYRDLATIDAARIGLAVSAYHRQHRSYPDSLVDVEKANWKLPLDPFTQKPYHYRRDAKGFTVWSVGPDMADNHATEYNPRIHRDIENPGYDFVFRCAR